MGILSLVLGILSLVIFWWLGPLVGGIAAAPSVEDIMAGSASFSAGAFWAVSGIICIVLPLIGIVGGAMAIKSGKKKGVGIAGLVCSILGLVAGLAMTAGAASAASAVGDGLEQGMDQLGDSAAMEDAFKKAMEEAAKQQ